MDASTILQLAIALAGTGGAGAFFGRWLSHKERAAGRESDRYWRLVDEQQERIQGLTTRVDALLTQVANLQAEVHELRRDKGTLEKENARLRSLLKAHGVADPLEPKDAA